MRYLLDTHTLIWTVTENKKLSAIVKKTLEDTSNSIFVSSLSFWEISLKFSLGKLNLQGISPDDFPDLALQMNFDTISLGVNEAATYHQLKTIHHRDPFDRMLIWQAIKNNLVLVSNDDNMPAYRSEGLKLLW